MDLRKNLGVNVSLFFLLALTIIAASVYYVANAALNKIDDNPTGLEIKSLLK